jgi:hypothetical protein
MYVWVPFPQSGAKWVPVLKSLCGANGGKLISKLCLHTHLQLITHNLLTIFQCCAYSPYQCCLVLHFQKEPSMVLLPFEIKNRGNTGIYYLTYSSYYYGGAQELLFCFYKFFSLICSDHIDVVFKVRD